MEEVKFITLDGKDFIITHEFDIKNIHYMIAGSETNSNEISVLRQSIVNGEEFVESVKDDEELEMVLELARKENN